MILELSHKRLVACGKQHLKFVVSTTNEKCGEARDYCFNNGIDYVWGIPGGLLKVEHHYVRVKDEIIALKLNTLYGIHSI